MSEIGLNSKGIPTPRQYGSLHNTVFQMTARCFMLHRRAAKNGAKRRHGKSRVRGADALSSL